MQTCCRASCIRLLSNSDGLDGSAAKEIGANGTRVLAWLAGDQSSSGLLARRHVVAACSGPMAIMLWHNGYVTNLFPDPGGPRGQQEVLAGDGMCLNVLLLQGWYLMHRCLSIA